MKDIVEIDMSFTDNRARTPSTTGASASPRPGSGNLSFSPLGNYRTGSNQLSNLISNTPRLGSSFNFNYESEGSFFDTPALNLSFPTEQQSKGSLNRQIPMGSKFPPNFGEKLGGLTRPSTPKGNNNQAFVAGQRNAAFRPFVSPETLSFSSSNNTHPISYPVKPVYSRKEQISLSENPDSSLTSRHEESSTEIESDKDPALDALQKAKEDTMNLWQSREIKVKDMFERIKACKRSIHEISEQCTSYWSNVQDRGSFLLDQFREHRSVSVHLSI